MRISLFRGARDNAPQTIEISWRDFCDALKGKRDICANKEEAPMFSPAVFDGTRSKQNVIAIEAAVADLDKLFETRVSDVIDRIERFRLAALLYTTFSHVSRAPLWCARLIIPVTRPVLPGEWLGFWQRYTGMLGIDVADPKCKDSSRCYFLPSNPPGDDPNLHVVKEFEGDPIDVDALLALPLPQIAPPPATHAKVSAKELQAFAASLRNAKSEHKLWLKDKIGLLLAGESLAEDGDRDETIFRMCCAFAERWPNLHVESLAAQFGPSLAAMPGTKIEISDVEEKLRRKAGEIAYEKVAKENDALEKHRLACMDAIGRPNPYTPEELKSFGEMHRKWIIQKDTSYWVFVNGHYSRAYSHREIDTAVLKLAPASTAGVELFKTTKTGETVPKTIPELMREYGTIANHVQLDFSAQKSVFTEQGILLEATCPRRRLSPEFSPETDSFLRLLAGPKYDLLEMWIAAITDLDRPCAALYLEGKKGTGKSLFAKALARIFTERGPTSLENAFSNFNETLVHCPVVLADEMIPRDFRGYLKSTELRTFIQDTSRPLNRKFQAHAVLGGSVRLVITANNLDLLTSNQALTENDIDAIAERIFHIHVGPESATFLEAQKRSDQGIDEDRIAKHFLWLVANRTYDKSIRFVIPPQRDAMRAVLVGSGLRGAVLHWLAQYALSPSKLDVLPEKAVRRLEGQLLVNAGGLHKAWALYDTAYAVPTLADLVKAIKPLSCGERKQVREGSRRSWYKEIDRGVLIHHAELHDIGDRETIEASLDS